MTVSCAWIVPVFSSRLMPARIWEDERRSSGGGLEAHRIGRDLALNRLHPAEPMEAIESLLSDLGKRGERGELDERSKRETSASARQLVLWIDRSSRGSTPWLKTRAAISGIL
jgi:hypothetical protein